MNNKIKIKQAARLMGASEQYVRDGLKTQQLPIGSAVQMSKKKYTYNISPGKLAEYLGMTIDEMLRIIADQKM